ncbi:MAG: hypothetical protein KGZ33_04265 [Alkaliphilus sp.]|nr:hypothetical protein [Alkaliphilus sp.]
MSELFSLEDIFNIMIELESMGNEHYSYMSDTTNNAKLKVLFKQLAEAELAHKELYEQFKTESISFSHEKVDKEYKAYIEVLLNQTVQFLNESRVISNFEKGFSISIQLEKDTILFLNEIRSIIEASYHEAIDKVITQEKGHLKALYEFKDKIK